MNNNINSETLYLCINNAMKILISEVMKLRDIRDSKEDDLFIRGEILGFYSCIKILVDEFIAFNISPEEFGVMEYKNIDEMILSEKNNNR